MDDPAGGAVYTDRSPSSPSPEERAPTRDEMAELLESVGAGAQSVRGRVKGLAHVVRVLRHCPWVAGTLRVEFERASDDTTKVTVLDEHGGARELALPAIVLDASFDELRASIRSAPDLFAPLRASTPGHGDSENAIVLYAPA